MRTLNVEALMTAEPRSCTITDTLQQAAALMWDNDCGVVPVVDASGRLAGIVTDRDVCMACYTQGRAPHEIPIQNVMSKTLFTLGPADGIATALALFADRQVRRAPVTNQIGVLVGMLSLADVVHASSEGRLGRKLKPEAVLRAVHSVSRPRPKAKATRKLETRSVIVAPRPKRAATRSSRKK